MTTYEKLDAVADLVVPILAVLALVLPWLPVYRASVAGWRRVGWAALGVAAAYAGMFADAATGAWPAMGWDYSTHSAVCVALLVPLGALSRRWAIAAVIVGLAYAALMVYQAYHSVADILTTAIPVGAVSWGIGRALNARRK